MYISLSYTAIRVTRKVGVCCNMMCETSQLELSDIQHIV